MFEAVENYVKRREDHEAKDAFALIEFTSEYCIPCSALDVFL
jgi:hypothetical protein